LYWRNGQNFPIAHFFGKNKILLEIQRKGEGHMPQTDAGTEICQKARKHIVTSVRKHGKIFFTKEALFLCRASSESYLMERNGHTVFVKFHFVKNGQKRVYAKHKVKVRIESRS
jgi:hypothetical protein